MEHKVKKAKVNIVFNNILSIIFMLIGIVATILFLVPLLYTISGQSNSDMLGTFIVLEALSVALFFWGYKKRAFIKLFKRYVYIISSTNNGNLLSIAKLMGKTENTTIKNLQRMINKKYFINAYIDYGKKELMIVGKSLNKSSQTKGTKCKNCGAYGVDTTNHNYCEYCGTTTH